MPISLEEVGVDLLTASCKHVLWSQIHVMQYEIAMMYTIMKMKQQNTTSGQGVQTLRSIAFENEELGKGQHQTKIYHFERLDLTDRMHSLPS